MSVEFKFSCCRIVDGEIVKKPHEKVPISDIILIDTIDITRNDRRLRARTSYGDFVLNMNGALSVMEEQLEDYGFWRSDTKNLVNMNLVDKVEQSMFAADIVFKDTNIRGIIAKIKINVLKDLFPSVPVVRGGLF